MEKGVQDYNIFLAIVSELYFTRPFCIKELEWAILKYNKPIIFSSTKRRNTIH
mgnify:CR=1 FL=1